MPAPLNYKGCTATILSGATASEEIDLTADGGASKKITLFPAAAIVEVIQIYIAPAPGGTYVAFDDSYGNIFTLQNGRGQSYEILAGAMKFVATSAVAADRFIVVMGTRALK